MQPVLTDLIPALPEIFLAVAALALLMLGVFSGKNGTRLVSGLAVVALVATSVLLVRQEGYDVAFSGLFITDGFAVFSKLLVLLGTGLSIIIAQNFIAREDMDRFEYPVLMLLATVGMMMMVSANDLLTLYVGLELQSLSLYVIASFRRDYAKSTEAGLKYFVLGALSSGMLLYGISLIYGFAGTTNFITIAQVLQAGPASLGVIVGLVFVAAGLAFKISAVPFHMWTPDVYEGAPTPVTAFFAVAPKVAAICLFIRVLEGPFGSLLPQWRQVIEFCSVASMVVGSLAAIRQSNIKRLMAYSSIANIGYALVGVAAGTAEGVQAVLIYMAIYLVMTVGTFAIIIGMRQKGKAVEEIADLAGLSKTNPMLALALAVFMFSMAGVPPAAGFFGKLLVFMAAWKAGLYPLSIIMALTSGISLYYYLKICKVSWFDDVKEPLDRPTAGLSWVVTATALVVFPVALVIGTPVLNSAAAAAASLFH
ncbi:MULTISPECIES: NADH-quinone oxidoreductase subunit NuoN [Nitrospirillum]|uniref:NADH-quinone oxidoreductase subunit N n=1 Tax=Nitrospirillum amazonense TaxID=28077 RepID=A0A560G154_9PROT|nr:NADH-quinone oxidoreductase subunit NuoN [Nitrospirillum amazonense]MEC4589564.1 NADH-quinone oxidoreductase subunit NuoN [Nitrospirillum amazonense]TWB27623.1 NADH dehydrogenase subunit N [Nitrospirillum amazonense]